MLRPIRDYVVGQVVDAAPVVPNGIVAPLPGRERWFVGRLGNRASKSIIDDIENLGLFVYQPMMTVWSKRKNGQSKKAWAESREKFDRPLFPGYVFVGFDRDHTCFSAVAGKSGVRGMYGFVADDRGPVAIRSSQVANLQAMQIVGAFDETRAPHPDDPVDPATLKQGVMVKIIDGAFAGLAAKIMKAPVSERLRIFIKGAKLEFPADVSVADVELM
jgi:transcription antitermination factor NusG